MYLPVDDTEFPDSRFLGKGTENDLINKMVWEATSTRYKTTPKEDNCGRCQDV